MAVNYETLTIKIQADSKQANTNVDKLSTNLQKLNNTVETLDFEKLSRAQKLLQDIANIDFTNVSQGLTDVVKAFAVLGKDNTIKDFGKGRKKLRTAF